jgi:hypothetical protein
MVGLVISEPARTLRLSVNEIWPSYQDKIPQPTKKVPSLIQLPSLETL